MPYKDRKNFHVLADALVTRIIMKDDGNGVEVEAAGVEFEYDGKTHIVVANKEVIVSAG